MRTGLYTIFSVIFLLLSTSVMHRYAAQETVPEGYCLVDSVIFRPAAVMDSTLVGKNIFALFPTDGVSGKVSIVQPVEVRASMATHILANSERTISGYRVRIFFDNKQTARTESEEALKKFESLYHDVSAYRSYANPYFKVTVGDFRTKSEAMELLERIKYEFPSSFVVKETIAFPVVDKSAAYVTDTIKVLKPLNEVTVSL